MFDPDELAGIVDCFGALTRDELARACSETAFRRGDDVSEETLRAAIASATDDYAIVEHDGALVPGPAAFPTLPDGAEDLPHIMDVEHRPIDREAVAETVADQFRADVDDAVQGGDSDRCRALLDRTYEVESWGPIDLTEERSRLDDRLASLEE